MFKLNRISPCLSFQKRTKFGTFMLYRILQCLRNSAVQSQGGRGAARQGEERQGRVGIGGTGRGGHHRTDEEGIQGMSSRGKGRVG